MPAKEQALLEECAVEVDAAVADYLARAKPSTDAMFDHLFAALPAHLREQRLTARHYSSKPAARNPAVIELAKITMVEAIAMAHGWEMQHDADVVVIGQDVGANGGVFRATAGLQERFGKRSGAGHAAGRSDHRRHVGGDGDAWTEARRGNSVHGIPVSGAGSDREPHVADA